MHVFKSLPLKCYTTIVLDGSPADLRHGPGHVFQCAKETTARVAAITAASALLSMRDFTPTPATLPTRFACEHVVAASAEHLRPSAFTKHNWEVSFHGVFNPSSLHSL